MRPQRALLGAALMLGLMAFDAPAQAIFSDGFYVSLGVGYGHVMGDRGVVMDTRGGCNSTAGDLGFLYYDPGKTPKCQYFTSRQRDEMARTDVGSGLAAELRVGYNILGYFSVELSLSGNGTTDGANGIAYPTGQLRLHPIQFVIPFEERIWDVSVFTGFGYTIAGYHPDEAIQGNDDGKGWEGIVHTAGVGVGVAVAEWFSFDFDLRFIFPRYLTWAVDWDDNLRSLPKDTPFTVIIAPTLQFTFRVPSSGA